MPRSSGRPTQLPARFRDDDILSPIRNRPAQRKQPQSTKVSNMSAPAPAPAPPPPPSPQPLHPPAHAPAAMPVTQAFPAIAATPSSTHQTPAPAPVARRPTSSINWRVVERKATRLGALQVIIKDTIYPWNAWNMLRPGITIALLRVMCTYFILSDSLLLLHLEVYEIGDLEKLLLPRNRKKVYEIHSDDIKVAERVLKANIANEMLVRDLCTRLEVFRGVETTLEEVDRGSFDGPVDERVVAACEGGDDGYLDIPGSLRLFGIDW